MPSIIEQILEKASVFAKKALRSDQVVQQDAQEQAGVDGEPHLIRLIKLKRLVR